MFYKLYSGDCRRLLPHSANCRDLAPLELRHYRDLHRGLHRRHGHLSCPQPRNSLQLQEHNSIKLALREDKRPNRLIVEGKDKQHLNNWFEAQQRWGRKGGGGGGAETEHIVLLCSESSVTINHNNSPKVSGSVFLRFCSHISFLFQVPPNFQKARRDKRKRPNLASEARNGTPNEYIYVKTCRMAMLSRSN